MIEDPKPSNWKDLQIGVCKILNEVGISAELEKKSKRLGEVWKLMSMELIEIA
ncbi:hypothetical protein QWY96_15620 [Vibrio artabrorum]|uniref:Uncharacterized protein n=1 Tax=Vibrio artabrorum TaxID=446374 RepID=A0ABT8CJN7_9VIBR|nr:hypothetical protein [Vibrio artabrorum]MDN3701962.1 hypothetical protein [Vibrio artabrorum]